MKCFFYIRFQFSISFSKTTKPEDKTVAFEYRDIVVVVAVAAFVVVVVVASTVACSYKSF